MMTTYELIRRLAQVDPSGTKPVMLTVKTLQQDKIYEANGFIEELWIECSEDGSAAFVVLTGTE